jgi:hypothetical protein
VIEMNRAAERIVRLGDGLVIRNGQLCARLETARLAAFIAAAAAEEKGAAAARRMLVGRRGGRPAYILTVAPLGADVAMAVPWRWSSSPTPSSPVPRRRT